MNRANYSYTIKNVQGRNVISIIDHYSDSFPTKTVTNDIENVLKDIANAEGISPKEYLVVYRDSDNDWAQYDVVNDDFYFIADSEEEVITLAIKKQLDLL